MTEIPVEIPRREPRLTSPLSKPNRPPIPPPAPPPIVPDTPLGIPIPGITLRKELADLAHRQAARTSFGGKPKVVFFVGRGKTGKSTNIRYLASEMDHRGSGFGVLDADNNNPILSKFIDTCYLPPDHEETALQEWIMKQITSAIPNGYHLLVDLAGGDKVFPAMIQSDTEFVNSIEDLGGSVIVCCAIGPQPLDLAPLAYLHRAGLKPNATVLLLNESALGTRLRADSFSAIRENKFFKELIDDHRAVPLLIPRLGIADDVELRQVNFHEAAYGPMTENSLSISRRYVLKVWLRRMSEAYDPIWEWLS